MEVGHTFVAVVFIIFSMMCAGTTWTLKDIVLMTRCGKLWTLWIWRIRSSSWVDSSVCLFYSFCVLTLTHNITSSFIVVKTERSTFTTICHAGRLYSQCLCCHAGQQPMTRLSHRTATTTRFSSKAARNRRRQGIANIWSGGLLPRKHSPDGATAHIRLNGSATHLSTSEGWKAELA